MIAICTPELHGDVLWTVPAARYLARKHGCLVDYWLSYRGASTADLLRVQTFVNDVILDGVWVPRGGRTEEVDLARGNYEAVYQLGFHESLDNLTLLDYFCRRAGVPRQGHHLEIPVGCPEEPLPEVPYIVMDAKKVDGSMHRWHEMFREFVRHCSLPVLEIGVPGCAVAVDCGSIDHCRHGFLHAAACIAQCKYFVGTISAPLVMADAFPEVRRIAVHDGRSWCMDQVTKSPMNYYPVTFDYREILRHINPVITGKELRSYRG